MDQPHVAEPGGLVFLVSGATMDGVSVGPVFVPAGEAHLLARTSIAGVGGTVRILRSAAAGWAEVARYTDTGGCRTSGGAGVDRAAAVAG